MDNKIKKKIACYRLLVEDNDETEVNCVSLVLDPAIQIDWFAFSNIETKPKVEEIKFKVTNPAKRMVSGVFMKANKPIYRVDKETGEEYFVVFTADDIERAVKKFNKNGYRNNINIEHDGAAPGCFVMDSWFVRDSESNPLKHFGFNDVEPGDWVGTIHIESEQMYNDFIKSGKVKGFSVEGLFTFGKKTLIDEFSVQKIEEKFTSEELETIKKLTDLFFDFIEDEE